MVPYWKRVPITAPPVMLELDSTHIKEGSQGFLHFPPHSFIRRQEDPFDFYEDALGG